MSIWFFLWVSLSAALLYFFGWTLVIAYRQKQVWHGYAQRKNLRYTSKSLMSPPEIGGAIGKYTINLFTGQHVSADERTTRKLTAIEVQLLSDMPFACAVASGEMVKIVQEIGFREEYRPDYEAWEKSYIAASDNREALKLYLTKERLEALCRLMKIKNAWVILIFKNDTALLRLDTPDPLSSKKKINAYVNKMLSLAEIFELQPGESALIKSQKIKRETAAVDYDVPDDGFISNLELEEEGQVEENTHAEPEKSPADSPPTEKS